MKRIFIGSLIVTFIVSLFAVDMAFAARRKSSKKDTPQVEEPAAPVKQEPATENESNNEDEEEEAAPPPAPTWTGAQFEYVAIKMGKPTSKKNQAKLNELGSQGWRLISGYNHDGYTKYLIFGRQTR